VEVAGLKLPWFFPETPDVLGMLGAQAGVTVKGLEALVAWAASGGDPAEAERVRDIEHAADDRKRELRKALTEAFITPLDAEDLYTMSERLDAVMNGAKDAVRESEVMGLAPDEYVAEMAGFLVEGVRQLEESFAKLKSDGAGEAGPATVAADAAIKAQRHLERVYRKAASALIDVEDLREVMGRREMYQRVSRLSDMIVEVAERVWYATVKEG
jgi:uncharacterized protein Yka (UPF0111/DUF47 family)